MIPMNTLSINGNNACKVYQECGMHDYQERRYLLCRFKACDWV